jgi:hypothetical protein
MRIEIDIDCTPEEARRFLGLPDLAPMQTAVLDEVQRQMLDAVKAMGPEAALRAWLPMGMQGAEQMQRAMLGLFARPAGRAAAPAQAPDEGS